MNYVLVFIVSVILGAFLYCLGFREGAKEGKRVTLSVQEELRRKVGA